MAYSHLFECVIMGPWMVLRRLCTAMCINMQAFIMRNVNLMLGPLWSNVSMSNAVLKLSTHWSQSLFSLPCSLSHSCSNVHQHFYRDINYLTARSYEPLVRLSKLTEKRQLMSVSTQKVTICKVTRVTICLYIYRIYIYIFFFLLLFSSK